MNPTEISDPSQLSDPAFLERFNQERRLAAKKPPGALVTFTTGPVGTVIPVKHDLGRTPSEVSIVNPQGQLTVWTDPAKAWDDTYVYLQASVASTVATVRIS